jgi:hypothetical protein
LLCVAKDLSTLGSAFSMGSAARWTSRDARSLGRLESVDVSERMHEGSRFWLPENRTSTRTMGPCLFFSGYPSSRPGLHSIRARRGFAISRSRRNHPSVAPSRRDPCRWFRIGFWAAVGWLGEASPLCRGSAFLLTPFLAINEIYERAISTVHPSDRPLYESLLAKLP